MTRKDLTKEIVYKTINEVYEENNRDISITKLFNLVCKKLNCTVNLIVSRYESFNNILKELDINIPKNKHNKRSLKSRKNISDGMKNSEKFQIVVHSKERGEKISNSQRNSEKFQKSKKSAKYKKNISIALKNSKEFQNVMCSEEYSKSVSEGLKNSEKFQNYINSKSRGKNISEGIKNSEKYKESRKRIKNKFSLEDIKQNTDNKVKYERYFSRSELINDKHRPFGGGVFNRILRENNLTIDDFAKLRGVVFIDRRNFNKHIGVNEKQILDDYQQIIGYKIERQFRVGKYTIDGYVHEINTPVEVDEKYHFDKNGNLRVRDIIRENIVKNILNCGDFTRIKDNLTDIIDNKQKGLGDF